MRVLFGSGLARQPAVSFVLLDWSCRESFHVFDYLAKQTIPRDRYEVIWIEYWDRIPPEMERRLDECERRREPPMLDTWVVMEMPRRLYYHKHLMYNLGIVLSRGRIVTICDSDAVMKPTFVQSIVEAFEEDRKIVLHLDEVRNVNRRFYPFNYPSIEEIVGDGCINWRDGKTTGLLERHDPVHSLNYGACFCALRDDLIAVGGADEHIDYLGHIAGAYELTWRLANAGKREVWHQAEFLYHTWHPGSDGEDNYLGPHDGRNLSTTALRVRRTGRTMPLVENPAIRWLRLQGPVGADRKESLEMVLGDHAETWTIDEHKRLTSSGREAYARHQWGEAIERWETVLAQGYEEPRLLADLGWSYYFTNRYPEARRCFDRALRHDPKDASALRGRGWVASHEGDFVTAITDFGAAVRETDLAQRDHLQEAFRGRGWAFFHDGRHQEAIDDFHQALDHTHPDYAGVLQELYRGLGWAYLHSGWFAVAKEHFEQALKHAGSVSPDAVADARKGSEQASAAIKLANGSVSREAEKRPADSGALGAPPLMAAGLNPGRLRATQITSRLATDLGSAYYRGMLYQDAAEMFEEALQLDPDNEGALCGRGWSYLQLCRPRQALESFERCLEVSQAGLHRADLLRGRAWAFLRTGRFAEAVSEFDRARAAAGSASGAVPNILLGRSWACYRAGRLKEARRDAEEAARLGRKSTLPFFLQVHFSGLKHVLRRIRHSSA